MNTDDVHVAGTGGEAKRKKNFESLIGCNPISVERLERKMTATSPPRLPLCGKNLMEKAEGVKSAMICSSPVSVSQVYMRNVWFLNLLVNN